MSDQPDTTVDTAPDPLEEYAADIADRFGAERYVVEFDTIRVYVHRDKWVDTILDANKELPFFSWLSAIDWSKETAVGDGVADPDELEERFEVMCRLSSVTDGKAVNFFTTLPKDDATIASLAPSIGGAEWHEREAHDMFGIVFEGNPNLVPIYLPDDFIGNPLLKSYPLISREVKPWPGDVDVEGLPEKDEDEDAS
ncbi:MAG: NADH-quinone oxidoreductase subunit C [Actinomycetota bacterium]